MSEEFDNGFFSEEEIKVLKRMLPTQYATHAKGKKRGDFFKMLWASTSKSTKKIAAPLRRTLYALSKRDPQQDKPLSRRDV
jgi:hypothetical protein